MNANINDSVHLINDTVSKNKKKNKKHSLNQILISILLLTSIVWICLSCYKTIIEIKQDKYDLLYKESITTSSDNPYEYIYRRINRETGEIDVAISEANGPRTNRKWTSSVVDGDFDKQ